jgi:hypothetical protein
LFLALLLLLLLLGVIMVRAILPKYVNLYSFMLFQAERLLTSRSVAKVREARANVKRVTERVNFMIIRFRKK